MTVGSNSNAAETGIDAENGRAAIMEVDIASKYTRLYATRLRNPNGMSWQPQSGALWTVVNERDELGNDLVPDYMTSVKDGAFYRAGPIATTDNISIRASSRSARNSCSRLSFPTMR